MRISTICLSESHPTDTYITSPFCPHLVGGSEVQIHGAPAVHTEWERCPPTTEHHGILQKSASPWQPGHKQKRLRRCWQKCEQSECMRATSTFREFTVEMKLDAVVVTVALADEEQCLRALEKKVHITALQMNSRPPHSSRRGMWSWKHTGKRGTCSQLCMGNKWLIKASFKMNCASPEKANGSRQRQQGSMKSFRLFQQHSTCYWDQIHPLRSDTESIHFYFVLSFQ